MLKTEKLSAPQKSETKLIKYIVNTSMTDNEPTRKTRNLGKIKISSYKRPVQPSMQRIIKYSKTEWERQGHMRHCKNGKIVFVRPTTVKRHCVELDSTKNQNVSKSMTKYIIHDQNEQNNTRKD